MKQFNRESITDLDMELISMLGYSVMLYDNRLNAIAAQLKNINKLLKNHSTEAYHDNFSWPWSGDLEHISQLLGEVEKFLTNQD